MVADPQSALFEVLSSILGRPAPDAGISIGDLMELAH